MSRASAVLVVATVTVIVEKEQPSRVPDAAAAVSKALGDRRVEAVLVPTTSAPDRASTQLRSLQLEPLVASPSGGSRPRGCGPLSGSVGNGSAQSSGTIRE